MTYTPGLNGGRINVSLGGNSTSAGGGYSLVSTGTLYLAGGNNVTLSQNANTVTISAANQTNAAISAANGSSTFQTASFANSNGVSFSTGTQGIYATVKTDYLTTARASNDALGLNTAQSNVTWTANSSGLSLDARGYAGTATTFNGANISGSITQNSAGLNLSLSAAAPGAGGGIALANSQTTYTSGTANLNVAGGAMTIASTTGQSFNFSVPQTSSLSGTGAISISTNAGTISLGAPYPAYSAANGSFTAATATFANSNGVSFSTGTQGIFASHNGLTSQSNQAFSAGAASSAFQTLSFQDSNGVSFSNNAGAIRLTHDLQYTSATSAITASALNTSVARVGNIVAATNNTGGGTASLSGNVSFSNANNVTFYTSAGGAIAASIAGGAADGYNSAQFTNSTANSTMPVLWAGNSNGSGNITMGLTGSTVTASAGAGGGVVLYDGANSISSGTAVFSDANGVSFGFNGQTVTASVNAAGGAATGSYYDNMLQQNSAQALTYTSVSTGMFGRVIVQPIDPANDLFPFNMTISTMYMDFSNSGSSSISAAHTSSWYVGLYTRVNSTQLSLVNSVSTSIGMAANANNSASYLGARYLSFHSSLFSAQPAMTANTRYFFAILARTAGASYASLSLAGAHYGQSVQRSGFMGAAVTSGTSFNAWNPFMGVHSLTTHTALPGALANSDINKASNYANFIPRIIFNAGGGLIN